MRSMKGLETGRVINTYRYFTNLIEREMYSTGRMTPMNDLDMFLRTVRTNSQWAILVGNFPSIIRQAVSLHNGQSQLPFMDAIRMQMNFLSNFAYMTTHMKNTREGVLTGTRHWELMKKHNSPHIFARHDPEVMDIMGDLLSGKIRGKMVGGLPVGEWAMLPQRVMDQVTRTSVWGGAYDFQFKRLRSRGLEKTQAEKQAASFADDVVSRTQPPANVAERNLLQTGTEFERMLIPFTGQLMKNFDLFRKDILSPVFKAYQEGRVHRLTLWLE